jgi:hypothetical protein
MSRLCIHADGYNKQQCVWEGVGFFQIYRVFFCTVVFLAQLYQENLELQVPRRVLVCFSCFIGMRTTKVRKFCSLNLCLEGILGLHLP